MTSRAFENNRSRCLSHRTATIYGSQMPPLGSQVLVLGVLLFEELQLIQKSLIADLQDLGCLPTVPAGLIQCSLDGFTFGEHRGAPPDVEQRGRVLLRGLWLSSCDRNGGAMRS